MTDPMKTPGTVGPRTDTLGFVGLDSEPTRGAVLTRIPQSLTDARALVCGNKQQLIRERRRFIDEGRAHRIAALARRADHVAPGTRSHWKLPLTAPPVAGRAKRRSTCAPPGANVARCSGTEPA